MSSDVENQFTIKVTPNTFDLHKKELEVIRNICAHGSNKLVAHWMGITENTVKVHVRAILRKLNLQNRTLLAVWAVRNGLDT